MLSGVLALVFGAAAIGKVLGVGSQVANATKLRIAWPRYRMIAAPEALASVGLLAGLYVTPLGVAAAVGVAVLMVGALARRLRVRDAAPFLLGDATIFLLAGATAVLRAATG